MVGARLGTEQKYFRDLAAMTRRRLCISSFQDWTGAALNRSIQGLIDHVAIGSVSTEQLLEQLKATLQLSQSVATAWSDGAILDCAIAYNILLHQRDQALRGVSPLVSPEERERLRTTPFGASCLRYYSTSSQLSYRHLLPPVKHVLLHIGQHRLDPRNDGRLLCQCHCRSHVSSPFRPLEDVVQDVPFANKWTTTQVRTTCVPGLGHRSALWSLIQSMQQYNVVGVVRDITSPGCYSHLFLVPKKSGGWRPVIDHSFLNSFVEIPHFTIENVDRSCGYLFPHTHSQRLPNIS